MGVRRPAGCGALNAETISSNNHPIDNVSEWAFNSTLHFRRKARMGLDFPGEFLWTASPPGRLRCVECSDISFSNHPVNDASE